MFYVYKITNKVNGKVYIGKTDNVQKRWNKHVSASQKPNNKNHQLIHKAIAKYGTTNFSIEKIEEFISEQ